MNPEIQLVLDALKAALGPLLPVIEKSVLQAAVAELQKFVDSLGASS